MVRLLVSFFALLSLTTFAQDVVQNVSGQDGRPGYSGSSGSGFSGNGAPASQPSPGAHAKHLNVWVRAVENAPGMATLDFGNETQNVDLSQVNNVALSANGGAGGNGGDGGEGIDGKDGSDGASCAPFWAIPTSGENGGDGGNGGPGTSGADGGDAGDIQVNVEEEDAHLVAKMIFSARGGEGGKAGRDGSAGRGGQGGHAGATSFYDFSEGKQKFCIAFVSDGRHGSDGYSPRNHLNSGRRGRDGRISVRVHHADGSTNDYADVFKLVLDSATVQEEHADGVIEVGEKVKLTSLGIRNEGAMPFPGNVALTVTSLGAGLAQVGTEQIGLQRALSPGQGIKLDLSINNFFFTVTGQVEKGNAELDLGGMKISLLRKFTMAAGSSVQFTAPYNFTVGHPSARMGVSYANVSTLPRGAMIKVVSVPDFIQVDKTEFTGELAAGDKGTLTLTATPSNGARFGSTGRMQLQYFVTDYRTGKLKHIETQNVTVTYQPPQGIESVNLFMAMKPQNVFVTFTKGNKRIRLSKLWVKKASGTTISVQYEIDNFLGYNSPVYTLSMEEVAPLLGTLARGQALSRDQIIALLKQVKAKANDSWALKALE